MKVLSIRRWGNSTRIILSHPQGGTLSLPASETSWEITSSPSFPEQNQPLFDPKKLLHLSQWVEKLSTLTPTKASNGQQLEKVDKSKIDEGTMQTTVHSALRIKRTPETIDPSDSAVGVQNARPTSKTQAREEGSSS